MPAVQTSYTERMSPARVGMIANIEPHVTISRTVETAAGIAAGAVAVQGATDNGCVVSSAGLTNGMQVLGIVVREPSFNPENTAGGLGNGYAQRDTARIMTKGVIWVQAAGAVVVGAQVTVVASSGALDDTAPGAGVIAIPGAKWDSSTTAAGLARIRLG